MSSSNRKTTNNLSINVRPSPITINQNESQSSLNRRFKTLIAKHTKFRRLHIILLSLVAFCIFLLVSLCTPDIVGIDQSFQKIYYPSTHRDHYLFVYGTLINSHCAQRKHIQYTPKSQRKNPYILHDHFDPELNPLAIKTKKRKQKKKHKDNKDKDNKNIAADHKDDNDDDEQDSDENTNEFPVRIHHLRRGFYFDTALNDEIEQSLGLKQKNAKKSEPNNNGIDDNKFVIDIKQTKENNQSAIHISDIDIEEMNKKIEENDNMKKMGFHKKNQTFTALGVQFDEEYDVTVNGLLFRIDEKSLELLDKIGINKAFRRKIIPLQWVDFLYTKPIEFTNVELEEEKLNAIKKQIVESDDDGNDNDNGNQVKNETVGDSNDESIKKEDIEEANSMLSNEIDVQIESEQNNKTLNETDFALKVLNDTKKFGNESLIENIEKNRNMTNRNITKLVAIDKENSGKPKKNMYNELNEGNKKKYQLNVWTYIVPLEIMIDENTAQFDRVMLQSYIDVILAGCLDIGGQEFAKEFVQSTFGWSPFQIWNDDRGQSEPFESEEKFITDREYEKIDMLLKKYAFGKSGSYKKN